MKHLIPILLLLLSGCAKDDSVDLASFSCSSPPANIENVATGQNMSLHPDIFLGAPYTMDDGNPTVRVYEFSEMNPDTKDWCYYYSIDVSMPAGLIGSIRTAQ